MSAVFPKPVSARAVFPVHSVELKVMEGRHPFEREFEREIAENWAREQAANPELYDGQMLLHHIVEVEDGHVRGSCYLVRFSTFLYWRRQPERAGAFHVHVMAVPLSKDGALIAIKMSQHTANPGKVYCASGSLDALDIVDGYADIEANMAREMGEETGLDLAEATPDGGYYGILGNKNLSIFRHFRFDADASSLMERIEAFMLDDPEEEIAGPVAIRSADPSAHAYADFMLPLLDMVFPR
jgi:8-oxo-dGTP pyrophosphatase MutT (NUDIX family)